MKKLISLLMCLVLTFLLAPSLSEAGYPVTLYSQPINLYPSETCKVWVEGQPLSVIDTAC